MSSGWYRISKLVLIQFDLETCRFEEIKSKRIGNEYFAEGVAVLDNSRVYQLTYNSGDIITWDLTTAGSKVTDMKVEREEFLMYDLKMKEGWGLAARPSLDNGASYLYATDSTNIIKEIDPLSWSLVREIEVTDADGRAVK